MKLNVAVLNPAGNITLIVTTPVDKEDYADIACRLLKISELHGEQVGFLTQPKYGGTVRLEMMGGEFCGNALRSTGYYHAVKQGIQSPTLIPAEISGSDGILDVEVDPENNKAKADMPLPCSIQDIMTGSLSVTEVAFEGIVHFIADIPEPDENLIHELIGYAVESLGAEAAGVMFLDRSVIIPDQASVFIRPVVYVRETGSLIYESSCASGSTAAALACALDLPDGEYGFEIHQPGGIIEVGVTKSGRQFEKLTIGGQVSVERETIVEI